MMHGSTEKVSTSYSWHVEALNTDSTAAWSRSTFVEARYWISNIAAEWLEQCRNITIMGNPGHRAVFEGEACAHEAQINGWIHERCEGMPVPCIWRQMILLKYWVGNVQDTATQVFNHEFDSVLLKRTGWTSIPVSDTSGVNEYISEELPSNHSLVSWL